MRRIDLAAITLEAWQRLDDRQRQRFAEMFLRAALRLGGTELRRWLRRRVRIAPLAPPIDLADFAISRRDMTALLDALDRDRRSPHRQRAQDGPLVRSR